MSVLYENRKTGKRFVQVWANGESVGLRRVDPSGYKPGEPRTKPVQRTNLTKSYKRVDVEAEGYREFADEDHAIAEVIFAPKASEDERPPIATIDAAEFEAAKKDPTVIAFARQSSELYARLRAEGRIEPPSDVVRQDAHPSASPPSGRPPRPAAPTASEERISQGRFTALALVGAFVLLIFVYWMATA